MLVSEHPVRGVVVIILLFYFFKHSLFGILLDLSWKMPNGEPFIDPYNPRIILGRRGHRGISVAFETARALHNAQDVEISCLSGRVARKLLEDVILHLVIDFGITGAALSAYTSRLSVNEMSFRTVAPSLLASISTPPPENPRFALSLPNQKRTRHLQASPQEKANKGFRTQSHHAKKQHLFNNNNKAPRGKTKARY